MNLNKLNGLMAEHKKGNKHMATLLNITETAFSNKRTGKNEFKASEIDAIAREFGVNVSYFFEQNVLN
jgi:transcriptional regulator with XRE-family HTH domain